MLKFEAWAKRWGVSDDALADLAREMGTAPPPPPAELPPDAREGFAQSLVRLEAPRKGCTLWRNNVGVLQDVNGRPVRYGLANESPDMNKRIKSSDLIGWRSVVIAPDMVGKKFAQFLSRECKRPGWKFRGDARETAQLSWINLVNLAGGDAAFATGEGSL